MRPRFQWRLRTRTLALGARTAIMGVLNVTPDSFSDAGQFFDPPAAVAHGLQMLAEGADIIDVGGESTRPGAPVGAIGVSADEELRRILPVITEIRRQAPAALISVDTYKAAVARAAVAAGAEIVNDISALRWDPAMAPLIAELECGLVLMHSRGRPEEWRSLPRLDGEVVELVLRELAEWAAAAEQAGIPGESLVLDPGFGFGKNFEENYPLLARFEELHRLGFPLLAGTSRKSFIARTVSRTADPAPPNHRLYGTLATVTAAILKGAHIVRAHDVAAAREAAAVSDEILRAAGEAR